MKLNRDVDSTGSHSGQRGILVASISFLKNRKELAVIVIVGTIAILSPLFLFACIRSMIPVDGIYDWAGVRVGHDFIVFYSSALLAMGGEATSAYDQTLLNTFQHELLGIEARDLPWRYPPIFFLFLLPLSNLSYLSAFWTWSALTMMGLMVMVRWITPIWYIPLLVPLCLPVAYAMVAGQNGILTATLIGAGLVILPRNATVAGITFGLLAYKPQIAVVIPFCLLAGRYYRAFISMAVTTVALVLLSWFVFGIEPWLAFIHGLSSHTNTVFSATLDIWERIPTAMITALQIFDSHSTALILQVCVALLAIALTAWIWRTSDKQGPLALSLVASIPLSSPYVWDYDMAMLIIPMAFLAQDAWQAKWTAGRSILLISMWVAEPTLRIISGKIGLQLGPFFWAILLGYSVFLVKQEQGGGASQGKPGYRISNCTALC
jgi:Glycosyltransferase family 87